MAAAAAAAAAAASRLLAFNVFEPPERPDLHATKQKLSDVLKPSYWEALCPGLHCGHKKLLAKLTGIDLGQKRLTDIKEQINQAGFAQVSHEELPWSVKPEVLAAAVVSLMHHGWPASLLVVYDELWAVIQQASGLMRHGTGGNACNMDILAWYVDPSRGDAGFSPHRDRQPDSSPATFRPDGTAMYATLWLPLTDATPENSCLYVIPRFADPGYYEGDPEDDDAPDPLTAALPDKAAYQHIRALPCPAGSACIFTHRTIHWGSKGRPGCPTPRISMSWGCADDAYEPAYFSRQHLPCPPLGLRLALAGAQMIVYHERFPAPPKQLALYYQAFTAQADKFDSTYRAKVMREFLDASKEATAAAAAPATAAAGVQGRVKAAVGAAAAAAAATPAGSKKAKAAATAAAAAAEAEKGGVDDAAAQAVKGKRKGCIEAAVPPAAAAAPDGVQKQGRRKRRRGKQAAGELRQPVAAAAARDGEPKEGKRRRRRGKQAAGELGQPVAAAAAPVAEPNEGKRKRRRGKQASAELGQAVNGEQQQQQQEDEQPAEVQKRRRQRQSNKAAAPVAAAGAAAPVVAAAAAAAPAPVKQESSEEEGDGIDWAQVISAAKARAVKDKKRRKGSGHAAGGSTDDADGFGDDDVGEDVMDMALDAVLDAHLAGEDFHDDFEDD